MQERYITKYFEELENVERVSLEQFYFGCCNASLSFDAFLNMISLDASSSGFLQSSTDICTTLIAFFLYKNNFIHNDPNLSIKLLFGLFFKKNCCIVYLRSLTVYMRLWRRVVSCSNV
jgi:hypothetical protein